MECAWLPKPRAYMLIPFYLLILGLPITFSTIFNLRYIHKLTLRATTQQGMHNLGWTRDLWVSIMLLSLCLGEFQMTFNFLAS